MIHPVMAAVLLDKLESRDQPNVALSPEDYEGTGLAVKRRLVTEDKQVMFYYVDRLQLIEHIRSAYNLHKKGGDLVHRIRG